MNADADVTANTNLDANVEPNKSRSKTGKRKSKQKKGGLSTAAEQMPSTQMPAKHTPAKHATINYTMMMALCEAGMPIVLPKNGPNDGQPKYAVEHATYEHFMGLCAFMQQPIMNPSDDIAIDPLLLEAPPPIPQSTPQAAVVPRPEPRPRTRCQQTAASASASADKQHPAAPVTWSQAKAQEPHASLQKFTSRSEEVTQRCSKRQMTSKQWFETPIQGKNQQMCHGS